MGLAGGGGGEHVHFWGGWKKYHLLLRFSPKNPTVSDSLLGLLLNGRLDFFNHAVNNRAELLFLFSLFLGSVFHEVKVSSLHKLEGVCAQRHSFMKAAYCRNYLKRRIIYSYGYPGSPNSAAYDLR